MPIFVGLSVVVHVDMEKGNRKSHLIDLTVGSIANHFDQLKDPRWILQSKKTGLNGTQVV